MWTKPYGKTGKNISAISFGGMRFQNPQDIDASAETVLHAYSHGVNYFDTAPYYCGDKSEDIFGAAIRHMKPDTFYISTKCGKDKAAELRCDLEKSLHRLGVQRINFYHIWCVTTMDVWKARLAGGAVAEAVKARDEGLIEHLVVSSHLDGDGLTEVLKQAPFEGVTLGYCAINFPYRQKAVNAAAAMGMGVVTMNPLAGGLIPQNPGMFDYLRGPKDADVVQAAIRFNISQPAITSALVGAANKAQVDAAVAAADGFSPYPAEHIESVRRKVMTAYNSLCTGCGYCLPCPSGLEIPQFMDAYNHKLLDAAGKPEGIRNRLKWHWSSTTDAAKACSMCGACESRCTQHLPIRERMKEIAEMPPQKP